ncbi:MAG: D-alanyl-D-alanine carboxypeptidase [Lachnospiraceae bacterium]|nr:D-alanyl-D-alanine carboxypeptidase [Lachnospiraceae bacterium]MDY5498018.1 D-alanyl-D-alanine carboxypeptidase family protein [Anaerobutyricum sp.]
MRSFFSVILSFLFLLFIPFSVSAKTVETISAQEGFVSEAPHALLMETSTGAVLYEKDADSKRPPASVTKIMTLLLIFEAIDKKQISRDDVVTVSAHAASMGGSQVFLEEGESQSVDTMIKCIAVASANDACVAMAEQICGSEESFVQKMNEKASALGMKNTHFVNCCGLDADGHYTTARDIALMSRELLLHHPDIVHYTTIWMENITHKTKKGESEFGLSNTNKMIRHYQGATGLKTGSTSKAGFCLSATATRNGISLIAVVMNCASAKDRVKSCSRLLDYGFSLCRLYKDPAPPALSPVPVCGGTAEIVPCRYEKQFSYVFAGDMDTSKITKTLSFKKSLYAPIRKGSCIGTLIYSIHGKKLGSIRILATKSIEKASYTDYFKRLLLAL